MIGRRAIAVTGLATLPALVLLTAWRPSAQSGSGQFGAKNGEWRTYGGDLASTRYSALDQINASNFSKLQVAWRFKTDNLGPRPEFNLQSTPLMVNGMLYSTGGTRRAVVALHADTGELEWKFDLDEEAPRMEASPRALSGRGLAYWTDGKEERILYVTPGYQLVALDAKIGRPVPRFGKNGIVDLKQDNDQQIDLITGSVGLHAAPVVAGNTIIIGAAHESGSRPESRTNVKGYVRGFDVRTGRRLWIFHTIPRPGEFGNETWLDDSWSYSGNTGVWAQMSVDEELGLAYLPVESPTGDYYGGHRPGDNLFGESLVAVDLRTGARKWHYQLVHHPIWDFDIPCAPILADITVNGKAIKAVAQPTKQGFVYVFDRVTGAPVWPIEERPVPQSDVPGEKTSPTQPFPTRPPAFNPQGVAIDDLIDFTPELRAEAVKVASKYKFGGLFAPPVVSKAEGPLGQLTPGMATKWEGGSYDPETQTLYQYSQYVASSLGLVPPPDKKQSDMNYWLGVAGVGGGGGGGGGGEGGGGAGLNVQGLPLVKPPWGRITAINLNRGEIVWQVPHGATPDAVKNHPALKGLNIPKTGRQGRVGTLVTRTLLVAADGAQGGFVITPSGQRGAMLYAYDKATGAVVGEVYMPAASSGSPMTYMLNGSQYIVVAISGGTYTGELLAFKLPGAD
jgi:quinoprotein glucose dehydrogenase